MLLTIITVVLNFAALLIIFHYFKWKITSFNFLESFEKKKDEIGNEINLMIAEIDKTTERNLRLLEAKIDLANEKIGQINEVVSRAEKVFSAYKKEKAITENSENIYQKLERTSINDKIEKIAKVKEKDKEKVIQKPEPKLPETANSPKDNLQNRVIGMYKNGFDIKLISEELGITSGEVELIISISK